MAEEREFVSGAQQTVEVLLVPHDDVTEPSEQPRLRVQGHQHSVNRPETREEGSNYFFGHLVGLREPADIQFFVLVVLCHLLRRLVLQPSPDRDPLTLYLVVTVLEHVFDFTRRGEEDESESFQFPAFAVLWEINFEDVPEPGKVNNYLIFSDVVGKASDENLEEGQMIGKGGVLGLGCFKCTTLHSC